MALSRTQQEKREVLRAQWGRIDRMITDLKAHGDKQADHFAGLLEGYKKSRNALENAGVNVPDRLGTLERQQNDLEKQVTAALTQHAQAQVDAHLAGSNMAAGVGDMNHEHYAAQAVITAKSFEKVKKVTPPKSCWASWCCFNSSTSPQSKTDTHARLLDNPVASDPYAAPTVMSRN